MSREHVHLDMLTDKLSLEIIAAALKSVLINSEAESCRPSNLPQQSTAFFKIPDLDLLRLCLPRDVLEIFLDTNLRSRFILLFLLRRRITLLNMILHHASFQRRQQSEAAEALLQQAKQWPGGFQEDELRAAQLFADGSFWGIENSGERDFPIIGFSSLGMHITPPKSAFQCRAFDAYEIPNCDRHTSHIFCNKHKSEGWWEYSLDNDTTTTPRSVQATMFEFHGNINNISTYDEESLETLTHNFWKKFKNRSAHSPSEQANVLPSLAYFGYVNVEELRSEGRTLLRKKFLEKAKNLHPDHGGSHQEFLRLQSYYNCLKDQLT